MSADVEPVHIPKSEPLTFIEGRELEVGQVFAQLCIAGRLLEHAVCFALVKLDVTS